MYFCLSGKIFSNKEQRELKACNFNFSSNIFPETEEISSIL